MSNNQRTTRRRALANTILEGMTPISPTSENESITTTTPPPRKRTRALTPVATPEQPKKHSKPTRSLHPGHRDPAEVDEPQTSLSDTQLDDENAESAEQIYLETMSQIVDQRKRSSRRTKALAKTRREATADLVEVLLLSKRPWIRVGSPEQPEFLRLKTQTSRRALKHETLDEVAQELWEYLANDVKSDGENRQNDILEFLYAQLQERSLSYAQTIVLGPRPGRLSGDAKLIAQAGKLDDSIPSTIELEDGTIVPLVREEFLQTVEKYQQVQAQIKTQQQTHREKLQPLQARIQELEESVLETLRQRDPEQLPRIVLRQQTASGALKEREYRLEVRKSIRHPVPKAEQIRQLCEQVCTTLKSDANPEEIATVLKTQFQLLREQTAKIVERATMVPIKRLTN